MLDEARDIIKKDINKEALNMYKAYKDKYGGDKINGLREADADLSNAHTKIFNVYLDIPQRYKRISGEVEARNVESRIKMTPEQRRNTTLKETEDVAREDQLLLFPEEQMTESPEDITRQQKFTPEEVYADAGLSESEVKIWKKENGDREKYKMPYPEEALKANKDYRDKKISYEEKNEIIERKFPINPLESVPKLPTIKEIVLSLRTNKLENGVIGLNKSIADGEIVSSRLDIPAYLDFGIYVDTIHGPKGKGVLGYGQTVVLTASKDRKVTFNSKAKLALNVAATQDLESKPKDRKDVVPGKEYKQAKNPFAVMEGAYKNESPESVVKRAKAALKSDEWVQVGFNPYRHAFFYVYR